MSKNHIFEDSRQNRSNLIPKCFFLYSEGCAYGPAWHLSKTDYELKAMGSPPLCVGREREDFNILIFEVKDRIFNACLTSSGMLLEVKKKFCLNIDNSIGVSFNIMEKIIGEVTEW